MHRIALLIALLALSAGAAAQREANPDKMAPGFLTTFIDYDSDGDGIVTIAEVELLVEAAHVRAVRACDTDGDQRLSLDEYNICNGTSSDPQAGDAPR
jgi:hypothetical protein